jgi:excisionase family DNA binding protein
MINGRHEVMTVPELAEYLQCNKSTIYRLIKKGQIPAFKVGADWRFKREVIEEWLEQQHRRSIPREE